MSIIYGYGEIVVYDGVTLRNVCSSEFSLKYSQQLYEYNYFDSVNQLYRKFPKPIIITEDFSLSLSIDSWNFDLLQSLIGDTELAAITQSQLLPDSDVNILRPLANKVLTFSGACYVAGLDVPIMISGDSLIPVQFSEITVGQPLVVTFEFINKPTYRLAESQNFISQVDRDAINLVDGGYILWI